MSNNHYFSASPESEERRRTITVPLAGKNREVSTASGVFSPEQLDRGTAVLLSKTPDPPPEGALLDLGCGWGAIALDTALRAPDARVWAVDVNERALALARANAEHLGLSSINACKPGEVPSDVRFAEIRSNPPIRVGKAELHRLLETWLPRLAPGGVAYLVVAKHLGAPSLKTWLTERFAESHTVSLHARHKGFHLLAVQANSSVL